MVKVALAVVASCLVFAPALATATTRQNQKPVRPKVMPNAESIVQQLAPPPLAKTVIQGAVHNAYVGEIIVNFGKSSREMTVVKAFSFFDSLGREWRVPAGTHTDGASIPRVLWTVFGGPFEGKWRRAAIVHDYYCDTHLMPRDQVNSMFYEALLVDGVNVLTAKTMYAAVSIGAPPWDMQAVLNARLIYSAQTQALAQALGKAQLSEKQFSLRCAPDDTWSSISSCSSQAVSTVKVFGEIQSVGNDPQLVIPTGVFVDPISYMNAVRAAQNPSDDVQRQAVDAVNKMLTSGQDLSLDRIDTMLQQELVASSEKIVQRTAEYSPGYACVGSCR